MPRVRVMVVADIRYLVFLLGNLHIFMLIFSIFLFFNHILVLLHQTNQLNIRILQYLILFPQLLILFNQNTIFLLLMNKIPFQFFILIKKQPQLLLTLLNLLGLPLIYLYEHFYICHLVLRNQAV